MALLMAGLMYVMAAHEEVALRVVQALAALGAIAFVLVDWLGSHRPRVSWGIGAALLLYAAGTLPQLIWGGQVLPSRGHRGDDGPWASHRR